MTAGQITFADPNLGSELGGINQCLPECHPNATCQLVDVVGFEQRPNRCICNQDFIGDGVLSCLPKPQATKLGVKCWHIEKLQHLLIRGNCFHD